MNATTHLCFLVVAATLFGVPDVDAAPNPGRVIEVIDGETLKVIAVRDGKDFGKAMARCIRYVSAPQMDQPYGKEAHARLKELVADKDVTWSGASKEMFVRRYKTNIGPTLSNYFRNKKAGDLGLALVSEGLAWVFEKELVSYRTKPGEPKKLVPLAAALLKAQTEASQAKRGLWAGKDPIAPWEWKKHKESNAKQSEHTRPRAAWSPPDKSWVSLFNGKDLSGWVAPKGEHTWQVKDGKWNSASALVQFRNIWIKKL